MATAVLEKDLKEANIDVAFVSVKGNELSVATVKEMGYNINDKKQFKEKSKLIYHIPKYMAGVNVNKTSRSQNLLKITWEDYLKIIPDYAECCTFVKFIERLFQTTEKQIELINDGFRERQSMIDIKNKIYFGLIKDLLCERYPYLNNKILLDV